MKNGFRSLRFEDNINSDYDLWQLFSYIHRIINTTSVKQLRKYNLSNETSIVLLVIFRMGGSARPIEIARVLRRKPQTITSNISRLVKHSLVIKTTDESRRNTFKVSLTKKGMDAVHRAANLDVFHRIMSPLSGDKHRQLREILHDLEENANKFYIKRQIFIPNLLKYT
jgi:DNA-binding MarR family transcriptional regulator